jgi:hypothetical protein
VVKVCLVRLCNNSRTSSGRLYTGIINEKCSGVCIVLQSKAFLAEAIYRSVYGLILSDMITKISWPDFAQKYPLSGIAKTIFIGDIWKYKINILVIGI